jgi:Arginine/serine-rich protein PNISR
VTISRFIQLVAGKTAHLLRDTHTSAVYHFIIHLMCYVIVQMMRVRQMLTEVLLEVTGNEIADVAHSVYKSAKTKQARGFYIMIACIVFSMILYFCKLHVYFCVVQMASTFD